jgi:predicted nucleic acid-binding Zn ribbon protein
MPTYVYETISATPERFEIRQRFDEPVLTEHPQTGEPVRRVMSGGLAILPNGTKSDAAPESGCGPETCRCGRFD